MQNNTVPLTPLPLPNEEIVKDYRIGFLSRQASLVGRKEVLGGKAKFGIFGDGKEVAQLAMARAFKPGDWRSGYYRDQTFMFAIEQCTIKQFFAQLYADASSQNDPASAGRQMNSHFATTYIDDKGAWIDQTKIKNSSADISPTGGQMARLLGLAYASKLYRSSDVVKTWTRASNFSHKGNEVAFGTIGNASTSEGLFWESLNAAGVLQVPMALSIWDDGYGISVPNQYQTTKGDLSKVLAGFANEAEVPGISLYQCSGFDYPSLLETYAKAIEDCRVNHTPCVIHVTQMTQPQGHSTSGSHERYKSAERLQYEETFDCLTHMKQWMIQMEVCTEEELATLEEEAIKEVESLKEAAWKDFYKPLQKERNSALNIIEKVKQNCPIPELDKVTSELGKVSFPLRKQIQSALSDAVLLLRNEHSEHTAPLISAYQEYKKSNQSLYSDHLWNEKRGISQKSQTIEPSYDSESINIDGRQVIQKYFDYTLAHRPECFIIGEDVGVLGGVNLEFEGLHAKFGESQISDTGIREATIFGQGLGAAMRGLRPIVDIQYLDYLIYALQGMSDDLATLHYRSAGTQSAPVIIRTKGHRLEGIWHTGSPIGMILGSIRGVHVCVPRNCVQAAGMYQTLLQQDDPALVIEVLNGYRVKERCPSNIGEYALPLGKVEVLSPGTDVSLVTYGANVRIAMHAIKKLKAFGISVELIDVQTLLPFDLSHDIKKSLEKTNAVLFLDEDVPGGSSAFMMQQVLETQGAYEYLDAPPRTLSAKDHRAAYGSDGDYFSKPNVDDIVHTIYQMMHERSPLEYPWKL
ncbi:MAG: transketolase [Oligoflexales bacterium]|nr:transketolase [Oligoflexales bacterium]